MQLNITLAAGIVVISLCLVGARHPFNFFDETFEEFEECLLKNNVSHEEYENFEVFHNLPNVLNGTVELKYKCVIHCELERQPKRWLNAEGKADFQLMNVTSAVAQAIAKCLEGAEEEGQCAYSFKLVLCAFHEDYPEIDYDAWELTEEELAELEQDDEEELDDEGETTTDATTSKPFEMV